jgi:RNA polymerase sigma-70 factor (ECF subfamily)
MDQAPDERDAARALDRARDTRLVLAIRAGDANAFGQLYDHWFDRVFDLASRIVRNPDIAAEVAQDTFLKAWRSSPATPRTTAARRKAVRRPSTTRGSR